MTYEWSYKPMARGIAVSIEYPDYYGTDGPAWVSAARIDPTAACMWVNPTAEMVQNGFFNTRSNLMRCKMCGTSSMIPESTDKIIPLVCPQCGGPLDG